MVGSLKTGQGVITCAQLERISPRPTGISELCGYPYVNTMYFGPLLIPRKTKADSLFRCTACIRLLNFQFVLPQSPQLVTIEKSGTADTPWSEETVNSDSRRSKFTT